MDEPARRARDWLRIAAWLVAAMAAITASLTLVVAFTAGGASDTEKLSGTPEAAINETPLTSPPPPTSWLDMLDGRGDGVPLLVACEDHSGDGRIDAADGALYDGLDIPLPEGPRACREAGVHAEYHVGGAFDGLPLDCTGRPPLLVVLVGGGGTNLLDTSLGESPGMIGIANELQARSAAASVPSATVLTAAAITGADLPQTRMEAWLAHHLARHLDALPCLRAVVIGHSHGGVTVTSVLAALEDRYQGRLYGVLLDRTIALYDRIAGEFPSQAPVLNVYQENEGWHGIPLGLPNVEDLDQSGALPAWPLQEAEYGPPAPPVTHLNLDDAPGVRGEIIERVLAWALRSP